MFFIAFDLVFIIRKTPSYKDQIKGDKQHRYDSLFKYLAADTVNSPDSYNYFLNLAQLIFPLRDNHLGFYQLAGYDHFKTRESIDSFMTTKEFLGYPAYTINTDSLKTE